MNHRTLLLPAVAALLALAAPLAAVAAPCSDTPAVVTFDVNPKTDAAINTPSRFTFKFRWAAACDGGVTLQGETHDIFQSSDHVVRRTPLWDLVPHPEFRDATDDNWDFTTTWLTTPGAHQFFARVFLDGAQITESAVVPVTAVGEGVSTGGGPSTEGGELTAPQAGPVDLAVTVGAMAQAADIPTYINGLYRYGLGVGVTLAMVMVVVGGFQYVVARGNPSAIGAAKSRITNAVIGLLVLFGSYTLLNTINPELVAMRNIYIPRIQSVVALGENRCENVDRARYTVSPSTGRCGETGTISGTGGTAVAANANTCTWGVCSGHEGCVLRGSAGYGCVACEQVIDDNLTTWGLGQSDAACRRFRPLDSAGHRYDCVFAQDSRFDDNDDVCAFLDVNCSAVTACGDYDAALMANHGGTTLRMEELLIDQYGGGERLTAPLQAATNFRNACNANPCGVSTGCHAVATTLQSTLPVVGFVGLPAAAVPALIGDFWDCNAGGAPPPEAPAAEPSEGRGVGPGGRSAM